MRVAVPIIALTAAVSSASAALLSRQSLPNCAVLCLANANTAGCDPQDDTCLCKDQAFVNSTTTCIEQACTGSDLANAEAFAQALCLAVGVTLVPPTPASTSGGSGPVAPTPAAPTPSVKNGASLTGTFSVLAAAVAALAAAAVL